MKVVKKAIVTLLSMLIDHQAVNISSPKNNLVVRHFAASGRFWDESSYWTLTPHLLPPFKTHGPVVEHIPLGKYW